MTYGVVATHRLGAAVDVSAVEVSVVILDVLGDERALLVEKQREASPAQVFAVIDRACALAGISRHDLDLVVIGMPASVDPVTDSIRFDDVPGWPATQTQRRLSADFGCSVIIENDVKLSAVAERGEGVARDVAGFALLWMGNGVGLALDINGAVVHGASGAAGEIGYLPVPVALHTPGTDPEKSNITEILGGPAVVRLVVESGLTTESDIDNDLGRAADILFKDEAMLAEFAHRISLVLAPVLAIVDPGLVVLSGHAAIAGGTRLADRVAHWLAVSTPWHTRVTTTGLPDNGVLRGARRLLEESLERVLLESVGPLES